MPDYMTLRALGLSKTAVICYQSLFEVGAATATQLAKRLSQSRTGLYRVLNEMERQGFVSSLKTHSQPTYFNAVSLDKALDQHAKYQRRVVSKLIKQQIEILAKRRGDPAPVERTPER